MRKSPFAICPFLMSIKSRNVISFVSNRHVYRPNAKLIYQNISFALINAYCPFHYSTRNLIQLVGNEKILTLQLSRKYIFKLKFFLQIFFANSNSCLFANMWLLKHTTFCILLKFYLSQIFSELFTIIC